MDGKSFGFAKNRLQKMDLDIYGTMIGRADLQLI